MIKFERLLKRARSVATGHVAISRSALDELLDRLERAYIAAPARLAGDLLAQIEALDSVVLG